MGGIDYDARIRRNRTRMLALTVMAAANLWLLMACVIAVFYVLGAMHTGNLELQLLPVFSIVGATVATPWLLWRRLRGAPSTMLKAVGARPPAPDDGNRLTNLAQEMAVARGIPPLQVAVIDDPAPNALAVGRDPANTTIAVTTGLVQLLTREELAAVVAVEVCSIGLHDVAVGTVAVACLGVVGAITEEQGLNRNGSRDWLGWIVCAPSRFFASKVRLMTMHDRETSADTLACETTRNPLALISALRKIREQPVGVARWSPNVDLWFHRPAADLEQRVAAIEAAFGVSAPPPAA
jgi:heat shock protein HtpX